MTVGGAFSGAVPGRWRGPDSSRQVIGRIADLVGRGSFVLDPVAGTGIVAGQLSRAGLRVVAAEADASSRAQLVRALPNVPVVAADPSAPPFAPRSFRAAVLHDRAIAPADGASSLAALLGAVSSLLAAGGLAIAVFRPDGPWSGVDRVAAPELRGPEPMVPDGDRGGDAVLVWRAR